MPSSSSTATSEAGTPRDAKVAWRTAEVSAGMAVKRNRLQDSGVVALTQVVTLTVCPVTLTVAPRPWKPIRSPSDLLLRKSTVYRYRVTGCACRG